MESEKKKQKFGNGNCLVGKIYLITKTVLLLFVNFEKVINFKLNIYCYVLVKLF